MAATRTLGFRLEVKGQPQTLTQLDQINKKLEETRAKIKAITGQKISLSASVDTKSLNDLNKSLDKIGKTKISTEVQTQIKQLKGQINGLTSELKAAETQLAKLKSPTLNGNEIATVNGHLDKMTGHAAGAIQSINRLGPAFKNVGGKEVLALATDLAKVQTNLEKLKNQKLAIKSDKNITESTKNDLIGVLIAQEKELQNVQKGLTKDINQVTQEFINQSKNIPKDSLVSLRLELSKLSKEYDLLSKAELESAKGQALKTKINEVTNVISEREQAVGNFRRNVGNYKSGIVGLLPELEKLQREGIIAQNEIAGIFKADLAARAGQIENEIRQLAVEFKELGTSIERAGERSAKLSQIDDRVRELATVRSSLDQTGNSFQKLSGKLLSVSDIVTGGLIGGGIIATLGALKSFGAASLTEFTEASTALAKINQQLIVTGGASGKSAEGLTKMAKELEVLTGIDGDKILNDVTSSLLRFSSIQGDVFDKAQKAAIDLSATMGGDLAGAANLVGKALEDPEKGITRLAKAGVILDKETEKAVKNAIKSNDTYKAQTILLGALESKFKGVAEAVQNTELQGIRRLTVGFNNFKEAVGGIFIRIVNDALNAIKDLSLGVSIFNTTNKELTRGLAELQQSAQKEIDSIRATISALGDENFNRDAKKKLIEDLVAKYPELINQLQLEYASKEGLIQIEKLLTATVIDQTTKRIESKKKEVLIQQQLEAVANLSRLQRGDLTFAEKFTQGLSGKDLVKEKENQIKALTKELDLVPVQFAEMSKKLKDINKVTETDIKTSVSFVKDGINSIIGEANKVLLDDKLPKSAKTTAQRLKSEFENKKVSINIDEASTDQLDKLGNQIKSAQRELIGLRTTASQKTKVSLDGEDYKKQQKTIEDNYKRILDLKRQIEDLKLGNIANTFDQQIEKIKATTQRQIEDIQHDLDSLELKNVKTPQDLEIIAKSKELISDLKAESNRQIELVNQERAKALDAALNKLIETQKEINKIISEVSNTEIDIKINEQQFNLDQSKRLIEVDFKTNLDTLNAEFAAGLLSEDDYTKKSTELEAEKFAKIDKLINDSKDEFINNLKIKAKAELDLIEKIKLIQIAAIEEATKADLKQVDVDFNAGKIKSIQEAEAQKKAIVEKSAAEIKKIETEAVKDRQNIEEGLKVNVDKVLDDGVEAHRVAEGAKTAITQKAVKERTDKEKEALQALKDNAIQFGEELAAAIFEINANRSEQRFENEKSFLEKEYDNRIKLAQGNSSEITKIERERDQKIKDLDREQARRRQKQAIAEAVIQGALGILKAVASFNYIAIPFIAATTAIQIAKIKSQSFAKGAYFNKKGKGGFTGASQAPPDETGERPIGTGILHADEFIATSKQTKKHSGLFEILDKDRMRLNAGQASTLWADVEQMVLSRRQAIYELSAKNKRKTFEEIVPIILPFGSYRNQKQVVEFTDKQIEALSNAIAEKVEAGAQRGTSTGSNIGIKEATKETLRLERTKQRSVV